MARLPGQTKPSVLVNGHFDKGSSVRAECGGWSDIRGHAESTGGHGLRHGLGDERRGAITMKVARRNRGRQKVSVAGSAGEGASPLGSAMLDRRSFLVRSGAAAAVLGLAASVPGGTAIIGDVEAGGPALDADAASATDAAVPTMTDPVVAHVTDAASGEISIYSGTREIVLRSPGLAAQLVRAAK